MNNVDYERYKSVKTFLFATIKGRMEAQQNTQKELLEVCLESIESIYGINKRTPKHLGSSLRSYMQGLWDANIENKTVFLYIVDGVFYSTKDRVEGINKWDTLPKEKWGSLGGCGGIYWIDTLKPFCDNAVRLHKTLK